MGSQQFSKLEGRAQESITLGASVYALDPRVEPAGDNREGAAVRSDCPPRVAAPCGLPLARVAATQAHPLV